MKVYKYDWFEYILANKTRSFLFGLLIGTVIVVIMEIIF